MAKYILNTNEDDYDFLLIGLVCSENQYRITSSVNNSLKINLCLSDYLPFNLKGGKLFKFSLYRFLDEELGLEFFLIPNSSNFDEHTNIFNSINDLFVDVNIDETVRLIKELPTTDYFIIVKGEGLYQYQFKIIDKLKDISEIIQIQTIEPKELQSKRNLIF